MIEKKKKKKKCIPFLPNGAGGKELLVDSLFIVAFFCFDLTMYNAFPAIAAAPATDTPVATYNKINEKRWERDK